MFALTNDQITASREWQVFDLFVRRSGLPVKAETIVHSAPDVQCSLEDGQGATFELMTLDSEDSPRLISSYHTTAYAWRRAIEGLTSRRRALFREIYSDAAIALEFRDQPDRRARLQRLGDVIACLLKQADKFKGVLEVNGDRVTVTKRVPERAGLAESRPVGFDRIGMTPTALAWARIRDKVDPKLYRAGGRCELIAYLFHDTLFRRATAHVFIPRADIRKWLHGSAFAGVWIIEWQFNRVYDRIERPAA